MCVLLFAVCAAACFRDSGAVFVLPDAEGESDAAVDADAFREASSMNDVSWTDTSDDASDIGDAGWPDGDATSDGFPSPALPGTVTVALTTPSGAPDPGVPIVFSNPDGTYLASIMTDSTGTAAQIVPAGAMVSALMGTPPLTASITTVTDVSGGDVIHLVDPTVMAKPRSRELTLTQVTYAGDAGSPTYYELDGLPCLQGGLPSSVLPSTFTCGSSGPFSILIRAEAAAYRPPFAFAFLKDLTFPDDGGAASLALDGPWQAPGRLDVDLVNVADIPNSLPIDYIEFAHGEPIATTGYLFAPGTDAGSGTVTLLTDPGFPDFTQTQAQLNLGGSIQVMAQRSDAVPTRETFDFSQALPTILSIGIDSTTSPGRLGVFWTASGSLESADGIYLFLEGGSTRWTVLVPPGATSAQLPDLSSLDAGAGLPKFSAMDRVGIAAVEVSTISGYAPFRQMGTSFVSDVCGSVCSVSTPPVLPANATYRASIR